MSSPTPSELIHFFEYELKRKLSEKARNSNGEIRALQNAFKFYDLGYKGILEKKQWGLALLRVGLGGFSLPDLEDLFKYYDTNNTGCIDYVNFTNYVYGREQLKPLLNQGNLPLQNTSTQPQAQPPAGKPQVSQPQAVPPKNQYSQSQTGEQSFIVQQNVPQNNAQKPKPQPEQQSIPPQAINQANNNVPPQQLPNNVIKPDTVDNATLMKNYFKQIVLNIQDRIYRNEGVVYYRFIENLKTFEDPISRTVSLKELLLAFSQTNINIDRKEVENFFCIIDYMDMGRIPSSEIIRLIKGGVDENRKLKIIGKFALMDYDKKGIIKLSFLKNMFSPIGHPLVKKTVKTEHEIYNIFAYCLDVYTRMNGLQNDITYEEFLDFCTPISNSYVRDEDFYDYIDGVFSLNENNIDLFRAQYQGEANAANVENLQSQNIIPQNNGNGYNNLPNPELKENTISNKAICEKSTNLNNGLVNYALRDNVKDLLVNVNEKQIPNLYDMSLTGKVNYNANFIPAQVPPSLLLNNNVNNPPSERIFERKEGVRILPQQRESLNPITLNYMGRDPRYNQNPL